jgi:nicotinamide phosphoribosyltransferase
MNPILLTDAYKISHPQQYPVGTEYVYSNITARKSRMDGVNKIVVFGTRWFLQVYLIEMFDQGFFSRPKTAVLSELKAFFDKYFGSDKVDVSIYGDLHDLGYLPLRIKALPEGVDCPIGVPFMTIENTNPKFYWLTNFIETLSQTVLWNCITSATIAKQYRLLLDDFAARTSDIPEFVQFQGHNFSMRGMSSPESGITSDMGHLLSFVGSDTLPGNAAASEYYDAAGLVSCSVPATEHAVMCAGGAGDERETYRRLIQDVYPTGIVSIVSDTWDLWKVLTEIAPSLKAEIEARDGTVVFRPDSGDPVRIICGHNVVDVGVSSSYIMNIMPMQKYLQTFFTDVKTTAVKTTDGVYLDDQKRVLSTNAVKGCVKLLDEHFGSTVNSKGKRQLNPKVGLIYGDSITLARARQICEGLEANDYASTNVVFGIGSYTYQYNTRDTFSIACKATWVQINGAAKAIYKDPITDDGTKKSACGLLCVTKSPNGYTVCDQVTRDVEMSGCLETVFLDGKLHNMRNFQEIREATRK